MVRVRKEASPKGAAALLRRVVVERVNEVVKQMDTVYLKAEDMSVLSRSLVLFRDRRELMVDLGLQHKLGVLLHGEPGTGKSTTIAAIATFLDKDIYYVSLGTVQTNAELRSLFDHVTKNCANGGGIVVMEDVDAMAPVVLRRRFESASPTSPTSPTSSTSSSQQDPLTLDFMLNVMQGTLTIDGLVFIATTNHLDALDPAFYRDGRFDVVLMLTLCDRGQVAAAFKRFFGREPRADVLSRVNEGVHSPATVVARFARFLCVADDDEAILRPFCDPVAT